MEKFYGKEDLFQNQKKTFGRLEKMEQREIERDAKSTKKIESKAWKNEGSTIKQQELAIAEVLGYPQEGNLTENLCIKVVMEVKETWDINRVEVTELHLENGDDEGKAEGGQRTQERKVEYFVDGPLELTSLMQLISFSLKNIQAEVEGINDEIWVDFLSSGLADNVSILMMEYNNDERAKGKHVILIKFDSRAPLYVDGVGQKGAKSNTLHDFN